MNLQCVCTPVLNASGEFRIFGAPVGYRSLFRRYYQRYHGTVLIAANITMVVGRSASACRNSGCRNIDYLPHRYALVIRLANGVIRWRWPVKMEVVLEVTYFFYWRLANFTFLWHRFPQLTCCTVNSDIENCYLISQADESHPHSTFVNMKSMEYFVPFLIKKIFSEKIRPIC